MHAPRSKFFQFLAVFGEKIGKIIAFHIHLWSWRPYLGEIPDPPLNSIMCYHDLQYAGLLHSEIIQKLYCKVDNQIKNSHVIFEIYVILFVIQEFLYVLIPKLAMLTLRVHCEPLNRN